MRKLARLSFVAACVAAAAVAALTQAQTAPAQRDEQKVVVNAGEVLFDVVVRDKRGRVVKDLGASDFEVYEDGVAQQLSSFRLVARGGERAAPAPHPPSTLNRRLTKTRASRPSQSSSTGSRPTAVRARAPRRSRTWTRCAG